MIAFILALFTARVGGDLPAANVQTGQSEAVFVPAGWSGPVVAGPFDEIVFEVTGG